MRTLDERNASTSSVLARWDRDRKLLFRLAAMTLAYFTTGALIRRRYRRCESRGETYWLDNP
jgi:hypothetical protein